ncbi:MAG: Eco57I restriction-modification methylase domain-containing protein, partial [Candidatus Lokiarchaeota archaeon]|nr:Eco57I restriction-modification methylase domain-containing protein [Candidatus Lokiarchaeota archaeon]
MISKKTNDSIKSSIGQIFTPHYVANFIVENALRHAKEPLLKALEPSVGEGVFIDALKEHGVNDIVAFEIDSNIKEYLITIYPDVKFLFENFLGIKSEEKYDLIVGNPPYLGQNYNSALFQDYRNKYPLCEKYFVGNMDLFYYFIHQSIRLTKPGGIISFITTNYWITKSKSTGIKFLKPHVLQECFLIEYIDLSELKVFKNAQGQKNCIFVLQKKTEEEILNGANKSIHITQLNAKKIKNLEDKDPEKIFQFLTKREQSPVISRYISALTNNDLSTDGSWFLCYPHEVKELVDKIERTCTKNRKITRFKDYFTIRNGMIFIKDDVFILTLGKNLLVDGDAFYVKIKSEFVKISEKEKQKLKKIYKSRSIKPYGYIKADFIGYAILFNKIEFQSPDSKIRNNLVQQKYPILSHYIKQYEENLRKILINAKENPEDFYFPRRGLFVRGLSINNDNLNSNLMDLEPFYDAEPKIFFKFVSSENQFGYSVGSYYATSDTYFVWLKNPLLKESLPFYLAYFNSKLFKFLFKAMNITVKRSKSKIENLLPVPYLDVFKTKKEKILVKLILNLSKFLIQFDCTIKHGEIKIIERDLEKLWSFNIKSNEKKKDLSQVLSSKNVNSIINFVDCLFFDLFDVEECV